MDETRGQSVSSAYFSPVTAESVILIFDRAAGLATVFLIIKLGWQHASSVFDQPLPIFMAILCFFHVMVYWINFHHFLKFSGELFTIAQSWVVIFMSLGLIFYPISLTGWIEEDNHLFYGVVNCYLTLLLVVLNRITPSHGGNRLYRVYRSWAPRVAFLWYLTVVVLSAAGVNALWMIWTAPFFFVMPLGAATPSFRASEHREQTEGSPRRLPGE